MSSARELRSSLRYTRVRWNSTVFGLKKSASAVSRIDFPSATWSAICNSCGVSLSGAVGSRRAIVSPVASSSARARSDQRAAPSLSNASMAECGLRTCIDAAARASQALPKEQLGSSVLEERPTRAPTELESRPEQVLDLVGGGQQAATPSGGGECPAPIDSVRRLLQEVQLRLGFGTSARPDICLDQVRRERQDLGSATWLASAIRRSGSRIPHGIRCLSLGKRRLRQRHFHLGPDQRVGQPIGDLDGAPGMLVCCRQVAPRRRKPGQDSKVAGQEVVVPRFGREFGDLRSAGQCLDEVAGAQVEKGKVGEFEHQPHDIALRPGLVGAGRQ